MNQEQLIKMSAWYDTILSVAVLAVCGAVAVKTGDIRGPIGAGFVSVVGYWCQCLYMVSVQRMIHDQVNSKSPVKWLRRTAYGLQATAITATILGLSLYIVSV